MRNRKRDAFFESRYTSSQGRVNSEKTTILNHL